MTPMEQQIEQLVDAILEDYRGSRDIDKMDGLRRPDKDAVIDIIDKLRRIVFPGYFRDKNYQVYNPRHNLSMLMEDVMINLGRQISLAYQIMGTPEQEAIAKAKSGVFGKVYCVEAQMSCPESLDLRHWLNVFPGGMMFFLGCHLIDLVLQIMGTPDAIVPLNSAIGYEGTTSQDYGMALLQYNGISSFVKTSGWELGGFERRQLVICGTKGSMELKPLEWYTNKNLLQTLKRESHGTSWAEAGQLDQSEPVDRYDNMMAAFAAMVRGEKENPYTPDYELELYKTVLKCCQ